MTTDNTEIIERRKIATKSLNSAKAQVAKALAEINNVRADCEHPNAKASSHMGESCYHCNDCGACD